MNDNQTYQEGRYKHDPVFAKYLEYECKDFYLYQETTNKKCKIKIIGITHRLGRIQITLKQEHIDFFRLIPYLLNNKNPYETQMKKYCICAIKLETYNFDEAKKFFSAFDSNLKRIHPFMSCAIVRLTFIRDHLTYMYSTLRSHFKNRKEREAFVFRLFKPIYAHYIPLIKEESDPETFNPFEIDTEEIIRSVFIYALNEGYDSKSSSDDEVDSNRIWDYKMFTDWINKIDLLGLEYLSEIIHQCCSLMRIPRDIATYHQLYIAFLSANGDLVRWLDKCQIFSKDSILYKRFTEHYAPLYNPNNDPELKRGIFVGLSEDYNEYKTSSLVEELIQVSSILPIDPEQKKKAKAQEFIDATKKHLDHDISENLFNEDVILTKFASFNQLIALSLSHIFEEHIIIQKCNAIGCTCYFPSKNLKPQYCNHHQNKGHYVKMHYSNIIKGHPEYGEIYQKFYNTLSQRIHRTSDIAQREELKNKFKSWKEDVQKLNSEIENGSTIIFAEDAYIEELNSRCQKYELGKVRPYKTLP